MELLEDIKPSDFADIVRNELSVKEEVDDSESKFENESGEEVDEVEY